MKANLLDNDARRYVFFLLGQVPRVTQQSHFGLGRDRVSVGIRRAQRVHLGAHLGVF